MGFTLIELLVVIAIITIITAIVVPNLMSANIRARVKAINSDMGSIAIALEDYKIDHGEKGYPQQYDDNDNYDEIATATPLTPSNARGLGKLIYPTSSDATPVYLTSIPKEPFNDNEEPGGYYSYFTTGGSTPTAWALVSWGPDKDPNIESYTQAWNAVDPDAPGYPNGKAYNSDSGIRSGGDIIITGP
ncbi:MAG: prepilin-type N-terminal cleavage/methylation domain-containing protein [Candidatus Aerophobetes bacterium]|nr:prepilin-type N-terminal cleavage/methylation domain-containing protein [Candidatus Aerophobetes bacterium]